jgi:hypothetical protein
MDRLPPLHWAAQAICLTLANKAVFSSALFDFPWTVLAIQSATVVVSLSALSALRGCRPRLGRRRVADMLLPASLFLLYQFSYARALRFISLPAYTVVKSAAPLAVTVVEALLFSEPMPGGVYLAILISAAANLLTFDTSVSHVSLRGYSWALFHVVVHIFYVLSLRCCEEQYRATEKAYLVNLLSLPFALPLAVLNLETATFVPGVELLPSSMLLPLAASFGLSAGCAVSVLAAYEAASSDALRYLVLFNKSAVVLLGAYIFNSGLTSVGWTGVALSIASGYIFVYSKTKKIRAAGDALPRPIVSSPSLEMLIPSDHGNGGGDGANAGCRGPHDEEEDAEEEVQGEELENESKKTDAVVVKNGVVHSRVLQTR